MKKDKARARERCHRSRGTETNHGTERESSGSLENPAPALMTPFLQFSINSAFPSYGKTINSHFPKADLVWVSVFATKTILTSLFL